MIVRVSGNNRVSELFDCMPEFTGTNREELLSATQDSNLKQLLKNYIEKLLNLVRSGQLGLNDIAESLIEDLEKAISLFS